MEEARDIDPVSTEGGPTSSNTVTSFAPVEPVAVGCTSYLNQTGSADSEAKLANGKLHLPVSVSFSYSLPSIPILAQELNFTTSDPFQPTQPQI